MSDKLTADPDLTTFLHQMMPLAATLGMAGAANAPDEVVLVMDWAPDRCTAGGVLHGGALMCLADTAGAVCAFNNLPDGAAGTTTIEGKTNFMGAVTEGTVVARARPLHAGRRTIVVETELRSGDKLVAKTTQTQAVL